MEQYYNYDREKYPFVKLVTNLFDCNLQELHLSKEVKYDFFDRPGKDSDTIFHQTFYNDYYFLKGRQNIIEKRKNSLYSQRHT